MKRKSFYNKILKLFLIIGIVPTSLIGLMTAFSTNKLTESRLISESQKTTAASLSSIETTLSHYLDTINTLDESTAILDFFGTERISDTTVKEFYEAAYPAVADLYEIITLEQDDRSITSHSSVTDLHLVNAQTGEIVSLYDTPTVYELQKNSEWGFYRKAQDAKEAVIYFSRYMNKHNTEMAATAIKAFYRDGQLLGYLALDIPLDILKRQTGGMNELMPMYSSLVTEYNYILWNDNNLNNSYNFISDMNLPKDSGYFIEENQETRQLLTYKYSQAYGLFMICGFNLNLLLGNLRAVIYIWIASLLLITLICIITAIRVTRTITVPLDHLTASMKVVEKGDYDITMETESEDEFGYVANQFNHMCRKIKETTESNLEKQELLRIAELKQLRSQINPHFLYNTLSSIKYLAKMNGEEEIFIMTKSLNTLLKNGLNISKEFTTLSDSLKNLSSYIAIMQIRFPDKFDVHIDVDESLMDCIIPNLILQPIVENAMLHGLEPLESHGLLSITVCVVQEALMITISDNGVGMTEEKRAYLINSINETGTYDHIGLKNVHQRIRHYYGVNYGMNIKSFENSGTSITLKLPYQKEDTF